MASRLRPFYQLGRFRAGVKAAKSKPQHMVGVTQVKLYTKHNACHTNNMHFALHNASNMLYSKMLIANLQ